MNVPRNIDQQAKASLTSLYTQEQVEQMVADLLAGKVVEIEGVKFTAVKFGPNSSPCFTCKAKFFWSKKICQVCISLDYSQVGTQYRWRLDPYKLPSEMTIEDYERIDGITEDR